MIDTNINIKSSNYSLQYLLVLIRWILFHGRSFHCGIHSTRWVKETKQLLKLFGLTRFRYLLHHVHMRVLIVAVLAKIEILTRSAMESRTNDRVGIAFVTYVVLMDYDSITQLFNHLLPAVDTWFGWRASKTNFCTLIDLFDVHESVTFECWSLAFSLFEPIGKIFICNFLRSSRFSLYVVIRVSTIDLSFVRLLDIGWVAWLLSKFVAHQIFEKLNHVVFLNQIAFALAELANRLLLLLHVIAVEYLFFFVICRV